MQLEPKSVEQREKAREAVRRHRERRRAAKAALYAANEGQRYSAINRAAGAMRSLIFGEYSYRDETAELADALIDGYGMDGAKLLITKLEHRIGTRHRVAAN